MSTQSENLKLAAEILEGVALGDAFGESFSYYAYDVRARSKDDLLVGRWRYTDDTIMSLGILECLARFQTINQDVLAWIFSKRYSQDPERGYGKMARRILKAIAGGEGWQQQSEHAFQGGSMGNGAAMRATPIGVWFKDDLTELVRQAKLSAQVTHWHHEGQMGAVAVAIATAGAIHTKLESPDEARKVIKHYLETYLEDSEVKLLALRASEMLDASTIEVAKELGAGQLILAQDTVPFAIWCALKNLDDYQESILCAVEANGDCDTVAAITGGIVTARLGKQGLPRTWLKHREPLVFQLA